jgi:uncharacterized protein (TIGR03066 family)
MKTYSLLITFGLVLVNSATAQDKAELQKQIVGKWEATHKGPDNTEYPISAEFTADGKLKLQIKGVKIDGTYTISGDKEVTTETNFEGKKRTVKQEIKITQDTMELKDPEGTVTKFKRAK